MKFSDIEFKTRFICHSGQPFIQAKLSFDNGWGASIIQSEYSYGGKKGLFELAVLRNGELCYTSPLGDDVIGFLTKKQVMENIKKIKEFK